jgi:hydrogenase expression/formation protein HypD
VEHLEPYRDPKRVTELADRIGTRMSRPWSVMEICGGQTHSIVRHGLEQLLPETLRLIHGPGCPVCVTPLELIDKAIALALRPEVLLCTFGDMLRVPGSSQSLLQARANGASLQIIYSPLDALQVAKKHPDKQIVLFAVGFETTAPATAMAARIARLQSIANFSMLVSHVLVPPALDAMLSAEDHEIDGLLAAGHVCTIIGLDEYRPIAERYAVPIVATGFEPVDILEGLLLCVDQLERGTFEVVNQYSRSVRPEGNTAARECLQEVFEVRPLSWRGLGEIAASGLQLRAGYRQFDAELRFALEHHPVQEPADCISGLVLRGKKRPHECPAFGTRCTPERPLGAPMVSSEGACAAYYRYAPRPPEGSGA